MLGAAKNLFVREIFALFRVCLWIVGTFLVDAPVLLHDLLQGSGSLLTPAPYSNTLLSLKLIRIGAGEYFASLTLTIAGEKYARH